jgi:hypothetical protein
VLHLLRLNIGVPDDEQCCPLLRGLVDPDAAVCLCLAIRANVLGIVLDTPLDLTLLLNYCHNHKDRVDSFTCPANRTYECMQACMMSIYMCVRSNVYFYS